MKQASGARSRSSSRRSWCSRWSCRWGWRTSRACWSAEPRAQTAADAAALAAAQELALSSGTDPADVAASYAERNGAVLSDCICAAGTSDATVTVSIVVDGFLLVTGTRTVTARARAVVEVPGDHPRHSHSGHGSPPWTEGRARSSREPYGMRGSKARIGLVSIAMLCALLPLATAGSPALAGGVRLDGGREPRRTPQHPADRERRPGVVHVLPRSDAERLQPVGGPGRPVQAGVREHVALLSVPRADRLGPVRARHGRRPERGHADPADLPDGAARRRVPHHARRQVHEQLAVRPARRVRPVGVRGDARDLLVVPGRPHRERRRGLAEEDGLRAGRARGHGLRFHQEHARGPAVLRDVHADHAAPSGRRHPVRDMPVSPPAGTGVQLEHHDGRYPAVLEAAPVHRRRRSPRRTITTRPWRTPPGRSTTRSAGCSTRSATGPRTRS